MQEFILNLIRNAGKKVLTYYGKLTEYDIKFKNPKDIVTTADKEIEEFIKGEISKKFSRHTIIAEESVNKEKLGEDIWYIDPIDGTTNFVHQFPFWGISIAYGKNNNDIRNSAIYFPVLNELFWAAKGKGAFKNGIQIYVSKENNLINSLLSTGFACLRAGWENNNLRYLNKILPLIRDIRRTGSACFDLCSVACGRVDGFWELNLSSWDIMAGILIVEEAGGKVSDFDGKNNYIEKREILATNGIIHNKILEIFNELKR